MILNELILQRRTHPSDRVSRESNAAGRVMLPLLDFPPTSFDKQCVAGSSFILIWPEINDLMRVNGVLSLTGIVFDST